METAVILLLLIAATNCVPAPLASYGYNKGYAKQAAWRAAWMKALHNQRSPPANTIHQENKIPGWANHWTSQPGEGLLPQTSISTPLKRSSLYSGRMPFRFLVHKNEVPGLNADMKKRSFNPAHWFRFYKDTEDTMAGSNYGPIMT